MNNNENLFWYGLKANLIQFLGWIVIFASLFLLFFSWILTLIVMAIGIYIVFKGKAKRFDYQRQSGNILHKGDW
jgi:hypothetical protein